MHSLCLCPTDRANKEHSFTVWLKGRRNQQVVKTNEFPNIKNVKLAWMEGIWRSNKSSTTNESRAGSTEQLQSFIPVHIFRSFPFQGGHAFSRRRPNFNFRDSYVWSPNIMNQSGLDRCSFFFDLIWFDCLWRRVDRSKNVSRCGTPLSVWKSGAAQLALFTELTELPLVRRQERAEG